MQYPVHTDKHRWATANPILLNKYTRTHKDEPKSLKVVKQRLRKIAYTRGLHETL